MNEVITSILVILIVFAANVVEGITGFAGTMLAMPVAIELIGIDVAKNVLTIVAIFVSVNIAFNNRDKIDKKEFVKITGVMFIGILCGLWLYSILELHNLIFIYAIILILVALKGIFIKNQRQLSGLILTLILVLAGIIHGMFLSGGSLLVIYSLMVLKDKSVIRATLAPVWIVLNIFLLIQLSVSGAFDLYSLILSAICIVPVYLALYIGNILHDRVDNKVFEKITYILILIFGVFLLV